MRPLIEVLKNFPAYFRDGFQVAVQKIEPVLLPIYWFCLLASIPVCIFWMIHLPSAGKAIGVLGGAGVIVALRGEKLSVPHKILWAVVTLCLLVIEVRAIDKDRAEQSRDRLAELKKQDVANEATIREIVQANKQEMSQNQSQFNETLSQMNALTTRLTGGDAYCYLVPGAAVGANVELLVGNSGTIVLPSCHV